jgi:hypothetical protein
MSTDDPSQPDLSWRGFSGWAMLPSFALCIVLSAVLLTGGWYIDEMRGLGERFGWWVFFQITVAIWIVQLLRWLYRGASYVYRLTPKFLYVDRGFLYSPIPAIDLAKVMKVSWGSGFFGRVLGVGWVVVEAAEREPIALTGLLRPAAFAEEIEAVVAKAKAS